ncbi:hypothetical protein TCE0_023f07252 [Talaromyces pinophilus]|uniref:Uncharacterized protein n=1 Tax=Talaromyces pinophilus TaxID=128442 RepID=A0A0B8N3D8_TALPI|nr:hypothetical protein TCE0_023f07252 [Talaromyces pinophilus]
MDKDDKPSSRLSTSRTFPVNIHHRHRSEATRPSNHNQTLNNNNNNNQTRNGATEERQPWPRRLFVDTSDLEPSSSNEKATATNNNNNKNDEKDSNIKNEHKSHRYSKSRDHRLPRAVNQIASAGGARNLLPNRSFHRHTQSHGQNHHGNPYFGVGGDNNNNNNRETTPELSLLKPTSSSREDPSRSSRFGSRSSSAQRNYGNGGRSRATSLVVTEEEDGGDESRKLSLTTARGREIKTVEDLALARKERERGEEILRSKLAGIGTLATDITRRLDYTYYNLLERISTLHSTIHTFQELVDSSATLHENFQRDNSALESDIHKQLADFAKFDPQRQRIDELERRMKAGRSKMENLGERLDKVRREIEGWERREGEWQARVTQRLRVLGGFVAGLVLMVIVAYVLRSIPSAPTEMASTGRDLDSRTEMLSHSRSVPDAPTDSVDVDVDMKTFLKSPLLTKSTDDGHHEPPVIETHSYQSNSKSNPLDRLRLFDEL